MMPRRVMLVILMSAGASLAADRPDEELAWVDAKTVVYVKGWRLFDKHWDPDGRSFDGKTVGKEYSLLHQYWTAERLDVSTGKTVSSAYADFYDCSQLQSDSSEKRARRVKECEASMSSGRSRWETELAKVRGASPTPAVLSLSSPSGRATLEAAAHLERRELTPMVMTPFDGGVDLSQGTTGYGLSYDPELRVVTQGRPSKVVVRTDTTAPKSLRVTWSSDEQFAVALAGRQGADQYNKLIALPGIAQVDLLDAGAGAKLEELVKRLTAASFAPTHQGKAKNVRPKSAIFVLPGFEPDGKAIAEALGLPPEAVGPLMWASPYAVTVAAGSDLAK